MKELNRLELTDILYGCAILGTGGGGPLDEGLSLIDDAFSKGKKFKLVGFDELDDDALIGTPYKCGAISPETDESRAKYAHLPRIPHHSALEALSALEDYYGEPFTGLVSTELGGGNTAVAFYTAAMTDKFILDADPAGRSVPELQHSTYYINDVPISPIAVANEYGDVVVFKKVVDDFRAESLVRAIAVESNNMVSVVDHPARVKELKSAMINGAISNALDIGKAFRLAKKAGEDAAQAAASAGGGSIRFRGRVKKFDYRTEDGFTVGEVYLEGTGEYTGHEYKSWFKNEHIFSWLDGEIDITVPDLICMIDTDEQEPIGNPYFEEGMNTAVFALPSPKQWRTKRGLEVLGPESFGKSYRYEPVAERKPGTVKNFKNYG